MTALQLIAGLALLVAGGDLLVRGAVAVARHLGVSPLMIGLTLVGFGTSTPELITSLQAAMIESAGIAVGNVVGSNIANILLILGVAAVIHPLNTTPEAFRRDGTAVLLATLACVAVVLTGELGRVAGAGLLGLLGAYLVYVYRRERRTHDPSALKHEAMAAGTGQWPSRLWQAIAVTIVGLLLTMLGARLLVFASIDLAQQLGISETVIGLTIVAVGTSLPELVVSATAAWRREADVAFGNVVGSNIYNVLGILGVTALVHPIKVPAEIAHFDIWVMLGATLLLLAFSITGWRLSRREGAVLLAAYLAYLAALALLP